MPRPLPPPPPRYPHARGGYEAPKSAYAPPTVPSGPAQGGRPTVGPKTPSGASSSSEPTVGPKGPSGVSSADDTVEEKKVEPTYPAGMGPQDFEIEEGWRTYPASRDEDWKCQHNVERPSVKYPELVSPGDQWVPPASDFKKCMLYKSLVEQKEINIHFGEDVLGYSQYMGTVVGLNEHAFILQHFNKQGDVVETTMSAGNFIAVQLVVTTKEELERLSCSLLENAGDELDKAAERVGGRVAERTDTVKITGPDGKEIDFEEMGKEEGIDGVANLLEDLPLTLHREEVKTKEELAEIAVAKLRERFVKTTETGIERMKEVLERPRTHYVGDGCDPPHRIDDLDVDPETGRKFSVEEEIQRIRGKKCALDMRGDRGPILHVQGEEPRRITKYFADRITEGVPAVPRTVWGQSVPEDIRVKETPEGVHWAKRGVSPAEYYIADVVPTEHAMLGDEAVVPIREESFDYRSVDPEGH